MIPVRRLRPEGLAAVIFFLLLLAIGLSVFRDYGIPWDEKRNHINGAVSYKYICTKLGFRADEPVPDLREYEDKEYGVFFELPLFVLEKALKFDDLRGIYLMRHFCTFLAFWAGSIFFYLLILERFGDWRIGLLGCTFLVLSPRIFANSFYNSKDLVLMSFFIIATYTMIKFLKRKTLAAALMHALSSAAAIDIRIAGIIIPAVTVFFYAAEVISENKSGQDLWKTVFPIVLYSCSLVSSVIIFWPYLWEHPLGNFVTALKVMSRYDWFGRVVLYMGSFVKADGLPWHYIPVWVIITTPVIYTALFVSGAGVTLFRFFRHPVLYFQGDNDLMDMVFLSMILLPVLTVVLLHSILYDGWRQMYFIYPAFLLVALRGLVGLLKYAGTRYASFQGKMLSVGLILLLCLSLINTLVFMIKNHPFQQVYFNSLAGKNADDNFELDYWGLSYRQALEYILKNTRADIINVSVANAPGSLNLMILDRDERKRINIVPSKRAFYYLTNFRFEDHFMEEEFKRLPPSNEIYSIRVNGLKIMGIYDLR